MTRLIRTILAAALALVVLTLAAAACLVVIERCEANVAEWREGGTRG